MFQNLATFYIVLALLCSRSQRDKSRFSVDEFNEIPVNEHEKLQKYFQNNFLKTLLDAFEKFLWLLEHFEINSENLKELLETFKISIIL